MLLEPNERRKFVVYCRQCAGSCESIGKQLGTLSLSGVQGELAKRELVKAMAYRLVADDLDCVEDVSITRLSDEHGRDSEKV